MTRRGFTLVELMVVLVVIGLMLSLAPAALTRALPGLAFKSSAEDIAAGFRDARGLAIRDNQDSVVLFNVDEGSYRVGEAETATLLDKSFKLALQTAQSEQIDDPVAGIRFFPDGTSTGGRVTLTHGEESLYINVDWLTGRVEILDEAAAAAQ